MLEGAYLEQALLQDAHLDGALLFGASLAGAYMERATLADCDIRGTDLRNVKALNSEQINQSWGDAATALPPEISRPINEWWLVDGVKSEMNDSRNYDVQSSRDRWIAKARRHRK